MIERPRRGRKRPAEVSAASVARFTLGATSACASLGMLLTLSGCPLKDDYFIDSERGGAGASGSGGSDSGGSSSGGLSSGGANSTGGTATLTTGGSPATSGGRWLSMAAPPASFVARQQAASVSFNGKLFIFGGLNSKGDALDSGAIYDLATDSWGLVSIDAATPSPRALASAVWTGSQVLVFGGRTASNEYYTSGALYDPVTDSWSGVSNAVIPRAGPIGCVTGNKVVFWGGITTGGTGATGAARYDLIADTWQPAASINAPSPLIGPAWALGAESLFVYGGIDVVTRRDAAFRYDLANDSWATLPPGPKARSSAFGAFDGSSFYVWAGRDATTFMSDGAVYGGTAWAMMSTANAPSTRWAPPRQQGWAFAIDSGDIAIFGGQDPNSNFLSDGGRYSAASGWSAIPGWPSGEDHSYASAALVGGEVLIWGGVDGIIPTATGERWAP